MEENLWYWCIVIYATNQWRHANLNVAHCNRWPYSANWCVIPVTKCSTCTSFCEAVALANWTPANQKLLQNKELYLISNNTQLGFLTSSGVILDPSKASSKHARLGSLLIPKLNFPWLMHILSPLILVYPSWPSIHCFYYTEQASYSGLQKKLLNAISSRR